jgi:nucleotide-binding universal stress UspA family protein
MTNTHSGALVSRQAGQMTPSVPAQAVSNGMGLPERLQLANALSKAGPLLPACYQERPGAILLLMSWAEKHGKDLLTAAQGVRVSDQGQVIVMAEMRVELANDKGFDITDITDDAVRRTECTVLVVGPGLPPEGRPYTVRLDDIHESIRSLTTKSGKPTPWATSPADMLLRTAQRGADKRFCRSAASSVEIDEWTDLDRPDVLDVLASNPQSAPEAPEPEGVPEPEPSAAPPAPAETDAEVDHLTAPPPEPITEEQLRRKAKVADLLRAAKDAGADVKLVSEIEADQALARKVMERVS